MCPCDEILSQSMTPFVNTDHNAECDLFLVGTHRSREENRRIDKTTRRGDGEARRRRGILR